MSRVGLGRAVQIDEGLFSYFRRPLMCIIAASDPQRHPVAGRAVGFHILSDRTAIEILFSGWQWPKMGEAIAATGKMAATFVSPSDYVSFQLKGAAKLRPATAQDHSEAQRFIHSASDELQRLGVPGAIISPWLTDRALQVAVLQISEIYVQTPGPSAGMSAQGALG